MTGTAGGPAAPGSPETAPRRAVDGRSVPGGSRAASGAANGPQAGAQPVDGPEAPQVDVDGKSPAGDAQGRQAGAQAPRRGTDGCQAEAVLRAHVRVALRNAGLSQAETARQLDVSTKHLCQMLTGRAPLTLVWAERILGLCGQRIVITVEPGGDSDAPGWCPSCGRGDVAPTGEQLAQAQREAAQARAELDDMANATALLTTMVARRAERAEQEAHRLRGVLAEVLAHFVHKTHPGESCLQTDHVPVATVERWRTVLNGGPAEDAVERLTGPDEPGGVDTDGAER